MDFWTSCFFMVSIFKKIKQMVILYYLNENMNEDVLKLITGSSASLGYIVLTVIIGFKSKKTAGPLSFGIPALLFLF